MTKSNVCAQLGLVWLSFAGCSPDYQQVSVLENASARRVTQAEPTVSYFGNDLNPYFVVCHNDDQNRQQPDPNLSGISCRVEALDHQSYLPPISVTGQAPFATGDPYPATDPWLTRDPVDPNLVWLVALMRWDSSTAGVRQSIGVAKIVRDPVTGQISVNEPNPGAFGDAHRMVPIGGLGIEGPANSLNGPSPDRPMIAIDPTGDDKGKHAQYIVFFQNDNTPTSGRRGRILVTRRVDWTERFWSSPVVVTAQGVPTSSDGWVADMNSYQFQAPQIIVHPTNHNVAVAFVRLQLAVGSNPTIDNLEFIGLPIQYFFGVSTNGATTNWQASLIGTPFTTRAGSVAVGFDQGTIKRQFTAVPYPAIAFAEAQNRWVAVFPNRNTAQSGSPLWELRSSFSLDGTTWSSPTIVPGFPPFNSFNQRNVVFPALSYDPQMQRLALAYMESADSQHSTWHTVFNFSSDGASSWDPVNEIAPPSIVRPTQPMEYSWTNHYGTVSPRNGYFGDYIGISAVGGFTFVAWPDSRSSTATINYIDVWGVRLTL